MGNIKKSDLENLKNPKEIINYICKKSWGTAIYSEKDNVLVTNRVGWFIGKNGVNINTYKHIFNPKILSFEDAGLKPIPKYYNKKKDDKWIRVKDGFMSGTSDGYSDYFVQDNLIDFIEDSYSYGLW